MLTARLWFGAIPMGDPQIVMTVEHRDPPALRASLAGLMKLSDASVADAALEAGDLERCLAWAWVSLANDDGNPTRFEGTRSSARPAPPLQRQGRR